LRGAKSVESDVFTAHVKTGAPIFLRREIQRAVTDNRRGREETRRAHKICRATPIGRRVKIVPRWARRETASTADVGTEHNRDNDNISVGMRKKSVRSTDF